jgi:hypothetical protein
MARASIQSDNRPPERPDTGIDVRVRAAIVLVPIETPAISTTPAIADHRAIPAKAARSGLRLGLLVESANRGNPGPATCVPRLAFRCSQRCARLDALRDEYLVAAGKRHGRPLQKPVRRTTLWIISVMRTVLPTPALVGQGGTHIRRSGIDGERHCENERKDQGDER